MDRGMINASGRLPYPHPQAIERCRSQVDVQFSSYADGDTAWQPARLRFDSAREGGDDHLLNDRGNLQDRGACEGRTGGGKVSRSFGSDSDRGGVVVSHDARGKPKSSSKKGGSIRGSTASSPSGDKAVSKAIKGFKVGCDRSGAGGRNALVRRGTFSGANIESYTPQAYQDTGADTSDKTRVVKRLSDAAAKFWPALGRETRTERVHDTLVEILAREERGETHKISWWAKWMFVRTHHNAAKIKEDAVEDVGVYLSVVPSSQFEYAAAAQAARLLKLLPHRHRKVMFLLADGANPLEISDETGSPIVTVLAIIREARSWLVDGGGYLSQERYGVADEKPEPVSVAPQKAQTLRQQQPALFRPLVRRFHGKR